MNLALAAFNWYLPTIVTTFGFVGLPRNQLLIFCLLELVFSALSSARGFKAGHML
jgi:hypothetical protein